MDSGFPVVLSMEKPPTPKGDQAGPVGAAAAGNSTSVTLEQSASPDKTRSSATTPVTDGDGHSDSDDSDDSENEDSDSDAEEDDSDSDDEESDDAPFDDPFVIYARLLGLPMAPVSRPPPKPVELPASFLTGPSTHEYHSGVQSGICMSTLCMFYTSSDAHRLLYRCCVEHARSALGRTLPWPS